MGVNDVDLTGVANSEAMRVLRMTMQRLDPSASSIRLKVVRRVVTSGCGPGAGGSSTSSSTEGRAHGTLPDTPDGRSSMLLETPRLEPTSLPVNVERMTG